MRENFHAEIEIEIDKEGESKIIFITPSKRVFFRDYEDKGFMKFVQILIKEKKEFFRTEQEIFEGKK